MAMNKVRHILKAAVSLAFIAIPATQAAERAPLPVAEQGYLFAGGKYSTVNGRQVMSGQLYAEYQTPRVKTHPYPIVMVHGAIQTGTNFTGTPDGREGWAQYFLRQGYTVYVIDQPGRARASYAPDLQGPQATPDLEATQSVSPRRKNSICGRKRDCTRNGPAAARKAIRSSISSLLPKCRSCRRRSWPKVSRAIRCSRS